VTSRDFFFALGGVLAATLALLVVRPLIARARAPVGEFRPWRFAGGILAALALLVAALALYAWRGAPEALSARAGSVASPHGASDPAQRPGSMDDATARLAARLARAGGSAADWSLLAQSYAYLGRMSEAREASARAAALGAPAPDVPAAAMPASAINSSAVASLPISATPSRPVDAATSAELARAARQRARRDFAGACATYARLAARGALDADGWADYADADASRLGGHLQGEPAGFIARALQLDARHPKALWLQASLALEEHRYADALAGWRALAAVLPADSPDQRIIAANVQEAAQLAGVPEQAAATLPDAGSASARITGVVELAAALAARAPAAATLFIYAKSPAMPGPPLAVLRLKPEHWPVRFVLDDSQAMIPGRVLSAAGSVELEARISSSGNAMPQPGDLVGTLSNVDPRTSAPVRIAIDHPIG